MDWFNTKAGVKQGDSLSPTMFGLFINDIVEDIKSVNTGIEIDDHNICILLHADDIVLLSDTEEGLQKHLDKVYQWSLKWKITLLWNQNLLSQIALKTIKSGECISCIFVINLCDFGIFKSL